MGIKRSPNALGTLGAIKLDTERGITVPNSAAHWPPGSLFTNGPWSEGRSNGYFLRTGFQTADLPTHTSHL